MSFLQFLPFLLNQEEEMDKEELVKLIMQQKLGTTNLTRTPTKSAIERAILEVKRDIAAVERSKKLAKDALKFQKGKLEGKLEDSSSSSSSTKSGLSQTSKEEPLKKGGGNPRSRRTRS